VKILLFIAIYAGLLFLGFKLILAYTTRTTSRVLERKHRDLEVVMSTGRAPKHWLGIERDADFDDLTETDRRRALRKLDKLTRYVRRSPFVDSDESRKVIERKLRDAKTYWKEAPIEDIVAP
jgi:hypothetical protein